MPTKDNEKENVDELTTDELLEKIEADKKQLKKSFVFAFAALVAIIILGIAWFVSNNRVSTTTGTVSAKSIPYCIATKETTQDENANYQDGLKEKLDQFNVGKGSELQIGNDTYYVSNGENIRIQVSTDNNLNNNVGNAMKGIEPGTSGKLTFYVIPREEGYKEFSFQMNLIAYKETGSEIQEITDHTIKSLLKGHILFFREYSEADGYTGWMDSSKFHITSEREAGFEKDKPIPITIYWVWPEYFQSFMKSGELFKEDEVIQSFVKDMNSETNSETDSSSLDKKYFYGFETEKFENANQWTYDSLNANQYLYLTECYNAADFQIGSNVKYIYVDFELK